MNELEFCRHIYAQRIKARQDIPADLRTALRTHERVPVFIDRLAAEFRKVTNVKRDTIEKAAIEMTDLFISCVIKRRDEDMLSFAAKATILEQKNKADAFKREADALEKKGADYVTSEKGLEKIHTTTDYDGEA